jgi:hypothetical protein
MGYFCKKGQTSFVGLISNWFTQTIVGKILEQLLLGGGYHYYAG